MSVNAKQPLSLHSPLQTGSLCNGPLSGSRYSPTYRPSGDPMRRLPSTVGNVCSDFNIFSKGNLFGGIDDNMLARVEALAAVDIAGKNPPHMMKHDGLYTPNHHEMTSIHSPNQHRTQMPLHGFGAATHADSMLDQISVAASMPLSSMTDHRDISGISAHSQMYSPMYHSHSNSMAQPGHPGLPPHSIQHHSMHELECDPRELEAFAERFKQRRIKLGVTQCDVGRALGNLKLPGVGSLSQSTICRFESLTLSHNNMIALKPVLQAWLEDAERDAREQKEAQDMYINGDKKRKRTSIAAPEKRSLEAYFAVQPRPSGEKISQIAEKLDLKKNVVRVWFCNQRQKQKRMKFSAVAVH